MLFINHLQSMIISKYKTVFFTKSFFLSPIINGKSEERICGFGPPLIFYLEEDSNLQHLKKEIFNCINMNYEVTFSYIKRFEFIRTFFAEDSMKEEKSIANERCMSYLLLC